MGSGKVVTVLIRTFLSSCVFLYFFVDYSKLGKSLEGVYFVQAAFVCVVLGSFIG